LIIRIDCSSSERTGSLYGSGQVLQGGVPVLPDQVFKLVERLMGNQKPPPTLARQGLNIELSLREQTDIIARVVAMHLKLRKVSPLVGSTDVSDGILF